MAVLYDIKVEGGASQWYGVISVTNIRNADGSAVRVNDFLGMGFHSPASVQPTDFNPQFWMWTPTTAETTNEQIDSQTWDVTAKLMF
ncbi:hypothetical protein AB4120_24510 [Cupriavidus sp. 2KB_3]|uniref:hypothetical protein n=1 Tax=Cupriavidus TaxID=106589 RepID=UPI0016568C8A|nr:hypothetical protein [Cupriavidus campinensis]